MKILIAGATGMVGQALVAKIKEKHTLGLLGRNIHKLKRVFPGLHYDAFDWDMMREKGDAILSQYDVIINLAGENIGAKRWSASQKKKILDSRVDATALIANQAVKSANKSLRILNASAIGIYGFAGDLNAQQTTVFTERSELAAYPSHFLSQVGQAWENALIPAEQANISVTKMRFGVVLSKNGGALAKMLPSFKFGLGAVLGAGGQPFSWICLCDLVSAINFLIDRPELVGVLNFVAPDVVSQATFAKTLAATLNRPCFLRLPSFIVRLFFGQMGNELLLKGQKVDGHLLMDAGFTYCCGAIKKALQCCTQGHCSCCEN